MSREDMIRMLEAVRDYMRYKDDSPMGANDIQKVITELGRLWIIEDNASFEEAVKRNETILRG